MGNTFIGWGPGPGSLKSTTSYATEKVEANTKTLFSANTSNSD